MEAKQMKKVFNRGNAYFDTYFLMDDNGKRLGMIEDHCRDVKIRYFIGWYSNNGNSDSDTRGKWSTKMFDTEQKAIEYSLKGENRL
jgi:hypothetical protein